MDLKLTVLRTAMCALLISLAACGGSSSGDSASTAVASAASEATSDTAVQDAGTTSTPTDSATESPSGTMIPTNASQITDSAWTVWTLNSATVYQQPAGAASATTAGFSANVILVLYYNGTVYQENSACGWWSWNGTGWSATANPAPSLVPACQDTTTASTTTTTTSVATTGNLGIRVSGNKLVSTKDGSVVQLRGANIADLGQLEKGANAWPTFGIGGEPVFTSLSDWNMNVVRLALNEANWLRYTCAGVQPDPQSNYQTAVAQAVSKANAAGLYVILDLHWAAPGTTYCPAGQSSFADKDHSVAFWTSVAQTFKGNPAVLFELFNEPFGSNVYANWDGVDGLLLRDGGTMSSFIQQNTITGALDTHAMSWQVAGFNELITAIRGTGATNVILASPIGWAGEIQIWQKYMPTDSAKQLAVAWHVYGNHNITAAQTVLDAGFPIVITETQATGSFGTQLFNWADTQSVSYLWWGWTPYSATDDLVTPAACSATGAFPLTASTCAVPTTKGATYKKGLDCVATGAKNCW